MTFYKCETIDKNLYEKLINNLQEKVINLTAELQIEKDKNIQLNKENKILMQSKQDLLNSKVNKISESMLIAHFVFECILIENIELTDPQMRSQSIQSINSKSSSETDMGDNLSDKEQLMVSVIK